ncbi:MAG TPA: YceI family protein [Flavipsychrobacter sp.]
MKKLMIAAVLIGMTTTAYAQKYMTRTGKVTFFSSTPMENIEAFNNETAAVLNAATGDFVFQVPIKSFRFEKALMQEHFNENYMESSKYPKAEYKGKITDIDKVNFSKNGSYNVTTKGKLTVHGVTRDVTLPGTLVIKDNTATINSEFKVAPKDHDINIPGLVENKIAKEIEVTVNSILEKK